MRVFATAYGGDGTKYKRLCAPGIASVARSQDLIWAKPGSPGLAAVYNDFIRRANQLSDCEVLVLLHDDVEIHDGEFNERIEEILTWPNVAIAGVIGGRGLRDGAWWTARNVLSAHPGNSGRVQTVVGGTDVDVVDGMFMAITRVGIERLHVDPNVAPKFHGYDTDLCLSARELGLRVVVADIQLTHHTKNTLGDAENFYDVQHRLREKYPTMIRPRSLAELTRASIAWTSRKASAALAQIRN